MKRAASLHRMASDDDQPIAEVFKREQQRLGNFIRRRVLDPGDAEDVLQDVFSALVEANQLLMPIEHVTAWLFRVARNRITDLFRRKTATRFSETAIADQMGLGLFVFVGGEVVRLLWNWLLPPLFGVREITFWQALGLLALSRILVGGFGMRGGSDSRTAMRRSMADRMADRVADRWERMSPEERERFRQRLRERCGFDPLAGESHQT